MMKHLNEEKIKLYEDAMSLHMFLISELGPTKFLFKVGDEEDAQKVKISLTNILECSCSPGSKTRCVHGIFAMVKVFKIPCENELVFQEKFTDAQVNAILEGRFKKPAKENKKHEFLRKKGAPITQSKQKGPKQKEGKREIDTSDTCPICYEELGDQEPLSPCKCCVNAFHIKCLLTWSKHQLKTEPYKPIKCPMCRSHFDDNPGDTIKNLEYGMQKFLKKEFLHPGTTCFGCSKKDLIGPIFTNIWQDKKIFCKVCFEVKYLNRPGECITKLKAKDQWVPVWNDPSVTIINYLINSLPSLGQSDTNKLQIVGFDVGSTSCQACKQKPKDNQTIRRLPCEHKVCPKCLKDFWKTDTNSYCCPIDQMRIFPALVESQIDKPVNLEPQIFKNPVKSMTIFESNMKKSKPFEIKKANSRENFNGLQSGAVPRQASAGRGRGDQERQLQLAPLSISPINYQQNILHLQQATNVLERHQLKKKPPLAPMRPFDLKEKASNFEPVLTITRPSIPRKNNTGEFPSISGKKLFGN